MTDAVRVTNFPDSGSPERVALDLMKYLSKSPPVPKGRDEWLDFYAECLRATSGLRRTG
ncbi:MAG TPA: hypothetical protein VM842_01920 [Nitrospira sp.]|nr:hypothetical protein [Nitrospira sp.]